jgi:hypothetical protein
VNYSEVIDALTAAGCDPRPSGGGYRARCPAHDDRTPSLTVGVSEDGRVLLHCHAGCDTDAVVKVLGITMVDLYPESQNGGPVILATYSYTDTSGRLLYESVRFVPKDFRLRRPDGHGGWIWNTKGVPKVPYRLRELVQVSRGGRVFVVEGEKDTDRLAAAGLPATTNAMGAGKWPMSWGDKFAGLDVVVIPDNDQAGRDHAADVVASVLLDAAAVRVLELPGLPDKGDVSDWLDAGHTVAELLDLVKTTEEVDIATPGLVSLDQCHAVFLRWFGDKYDLDVVDAALAATALERLDGDPLWLLNVSGSGNAKTETVQALAGADAVVTSTIASVGALLSATSRKDTAPGATGGLLRRLGDRGVLVIKDVTSILSMDRNTRAGVVAALREVYDGYWERNVGTDGGRSIGWQGRIVVIGAVTTAWDRFHDVVSLMGDRFVLLRSDSTAGRVVAARRAIANTGTGTEDSMRQELAAAVAGVMAGADFKTPLTLTDAEERRLVVAANLVTYARTAVDFDYRGDVIDSHAPEMPTRFTKGLVQVMRGAVAIGMTRDAAMRLALRCARDSMPPLRLAILDDLAEHPYSTTTMVRKRLG